MGNNTCTSHRTGPEYALRQVDKLEADRRRVLRSLSRCVPGSALAGELAQQAEELDGRLAHWRGVVARAEARGFKAWSREDFRRGDFVQYQGVWHEVLRVNAKSVTVPHAAGRDLTWTIGYHDGITGRMNAEEVADRLEHQRPKDHGM